jgi:uncharacterized protein (TIGR01777 family)
MKVVIAGGTGFLGRALSDELLRGGHDLTLLTRGASATLEGGVSSRRWVPDGTAGDWADEVDGAEIVINLAGESIASGRWTEERRARIGESRVNATRSLTEAILGARHPPRLLINASAQGYYGDRGDEELTEESPPGSDFLAQVCLDWETEARRATPVARVVLLRSGIVLDRDSGALPRMLQPFRFFGGGPVGTGRQFMSWIHRDDWVGLALLPIRDNRLNGALNLGSPQPVRNEEFAAVVGSLLRRPSWIRTPSFVLHAAMGEMADALVLSSTRMLPARALEIGYNFRYPELRQALGALVGRKS